MTVVASFILHPPRVRRQRGNDARSAAGRSLSYPVLRQAGALTVTSTDTANASITGSTTVPVSPAAADHLLFLQQPTDAAAGQKITPAVTVTVADAFGNVETGDNSDPVTLTPGTNPSGGTPGRLLARWAPALPLRRAYLTGMGSPLPLAGLIIPLNSRPLSSPLPLTSRSDPAGRGEMGVGGCPKADGLIA
jgi:hypothetical protein